MDASVPALVLRMEHHGALGVMRSLGRLGVRVYGLDADDGALALRSRYCHGGFAWDLDIRPVHTSVDFLLAAACHIGGRPLLLATNDETALFVAKHQSQLEPAFVFANNPLQLVQALYNKRKMHFLARQFDIPTAATCFPRSRSEVLEFAGTACFPVMLKAADNIVVARRTGKKMVIARTPEDLLAHYDAMEDPSNPTMMLQEYIPGGDDSVWMFNGYFNERSECLFGVTGKKIHQTPIYTGMTALGICLPNPTVRDQTEKLVKATGYKGILDIGYRYDFRDGSYKLLDANPRLGATFRLFVGTGEMDVVRAAYLDLTGQPVPASDIRPGRKWLLEDADLVSSRDYFRDRALTAREWIAAYGGIQEGAWFARDDLRPFLCMCARFGSRLVRHAARRIGPPIPPSPKRAAAKAGECHAAESGRQRAEVDYYFQSSAAYWEEIYHSQRLRPLTYQQRRDVALRWIAAVGLPASARVLDVGCGAGVLAAALATAGYAVDAIDTAPAMIEIARRRAACSEVAARLTVAAGDAHALPFSDGCFDVVTALGVLPWLYSEAVAISEMQRVLKPGGYILVATDNESRLDRLLDPISTPPLAPLRRMVKAILPGARTPQSPCGFAAKRHRPAEIDRLLSRHGLAKIRSKTVGFWPFTFCDREIFSDSISVRLDCFLRALAERNFPGLRMTGAQYMALAQKPDRERNAG